MLFVIFLLRVRISTRSFQWSSTDVHPSAEWVYEKLKNDIPGLSLGTVYRNIAVFKDTGIIRSVGVYNGQERFDAVLTPHSHFICTSCFKISDIPGGRSFASAASGFLISISGSFA